MDPVFDAQYQALRDSFLRRDIDIQVAYTPSGQVDYLYERGRLVVRREDNGGTLQRLRGVLPGIRTIEGDDDLVLLSIDDLDNGYLTVPEAMDIVDEALPDNDPARQPDGLSLVAPGYILHIAKICPAGEPSRPTCPTNEPCPPLCSQPQASKPVKVAVCDTGLLENIDLTRHPWLAGVSGEPDVLGPRLPSGLHQIPQYTGHGTFIAGVVRSQAPTTDVVVTDHFTESGGELEWVIIRKLNEILVNDQPHIVNLSAGTYTRKNWGLLGLGATQQRWNDVLLVTAAGNDSTDRPFYPAAFPWTLSVGALGPDRQNRAWFSNYGNWVDVYALGEGIVNSFATGEYTYHEPPRRPAKQIFDGMARWDGTSYAAPLVAGLIAARMATTGEAAHIAKQALLDDARSVEGLGKVLMPCNEVPEQLADTAG
jgi:hypothetical protein